MTAIDHALPIAVIGAGFSGTMAAIQLLATLPRSRPVLLCERADAFGRGLAYATRAPAHLLNLRAANMSAFSDRPHHFEAWLAEEGAEGVRRTPAGTFAPRGVYGRYLSELLRQALTADGLPRLRLVNDAVTDLEPSGGGFVLRTEGGQAHPVAGAVLAAGNLAGPGEPASRHRVDPWQPERFGRLHPHLPVLIVGTGLTMVDTVATLRGQGFSGHIVAVSRRGLLPNVHEPAEAWPAPNLTTGDLASLSALVGRIRREVASARAAGVDWRGVVDGLRPVTDFIWRSLPAPERDRFLRHLRPFWDVHRHRTAPPAAQAIDEEIARGSLTVLAGRIRAIADEEAHAVVTLLPRGEEQPRDLEVQCILDATGIGRVSETQDPLLRRLMARGLVRPGPFGLGLDAGPDYRALGTRGGGRLWTLGPLLRGVLWECIAVPDIRNQAAEVADLVAMDLERAEAA
ncbi:FAD/NAD(P)-binding protein [Methylobacterium segetis]|uniref:FAD/NAD(P)-binding protein n=1 Tax=Methylobacterium segetis TaxID=2488750 RepID=UPI00104CB637|nr:FAD/NAD(P)-binding protein [Methylobacterium segetis]